VLRLLGQWLQQSLYCRLNQLTVSRAINSSFELVGSSGAIQHFLTGQGICLHQVGAHRLRYRPGRGGLVSVPVSAGAIAVVSNLPGCNLRLSYNQLVAEAQIMAPASRGEGGGGALPGQRTF
jgi:ABC-type phosphate transport system substrate-binding protein